MLKEKKRTVKITQIRSTIGCKKKHKLTVYGLGLRRINHTVIRNRTPSILGMIDLVSYIVKIKE